MTINQNEELKVTSTDTRQYTMAQLRASKKSLYIRNNTGFLWTLHENVGSGRIDLELRPAGQRDSITYLPPSALDAPGIARSIATGKVTVSPDLEDEMVALTQAGANHAADILSKFKVELQESANARAISVEDKMAEVLANVQRKRIVPAGQAQNQSVIDEFINPPPIKSADGIVRDAMTGEVVSAPVDETGIKSVTITTPSRLTTN